MKDILVIGYFILIVAFYSQLLAGLIKMFAYGS